jgi:hypothetical protein
MEMEIYPGTNSAHSNLSGILGQETPSGVADPATLGEELPVEISQLDVTDPGWRSELQPPDVDAPHGYREEEVIAEFYF